MPERPAGRGVDTCEVKSMRLTSRAPLRHIWRWRSAAKTEMRQRAKTLHEPRDKTDEVARSEEVVTLEELDQVAINAKL